MVKQIEDKKSYKRVLPFLISLAKAHGELFESVSVQQKFIDLLEGCSSPEELHDILSFHQASRFMKGRCISFE